MRQIKGIIIHHSGGWASDQSTGENLRRLTTSIEHLRSRGIKSSAEYHYIVSRTGRIIQCADDSSLLGHCGVESWNYVTLAICFEGNLEEQNITSAQWSSGLSLITKLLKKYSLGPSALMRHKDVMSTACPGRLFPWGKLIENVKKNLHTQPMAIALWVGKPEAKIGYSVVDTPILIKIPYAPFISAGRGWIKWLSLSGLGFPEAKQLANNYGNVKLTEFARMFGYSIEWNNNLKMYRFRR